MPSCVKVLVDHNTLEIFFQLRLKFVNERILSGVFAVSTQRHMARVRS